MSAEVYFHIQLIDVRSSDEDLVTHLCFEFGAAGVAEELEFSQTRDDYQPEILEKETITLNCFFEEPPGDEFFLSLSEQYPQVLVKKSEEKNKDWLAEWKKGFKAFQLAGPYWVVPSWLEQPADCGAPIWIDPGMAFGTGTHATTQMASELLLEWMRGNSGASVLDVGTGTGILAFLAEKEGAARVVGTEIDEDARRVARENRVKNSSQIVEIPEEQVQNLTDHFDLVIANIIDGVLTQIRDHLLNCMKSGGHLLLSGILIEHEEEFFRKFLAGTDLQVQKRLEKDEWIAVLVGFKN